MLCQGEACNSRCSKPACMAEAMIVPLRRSKAVLLHSFLVSVQYKERYSNNCSLPVVADRAKSIGRRTAAAGKKSLSNSISKLAHWPILDAD